MDGESASKTKRLQSVPESGSAVFLLGAGVNQPVTDWDGNHPPLSRTIFRTVLTMRRFQSEPYRRFLRPVLDHILRFWSKTEEELRTSDFDIEQCITLLDEQLEDAGQRGDSTEVERISDTHFRLAALLSELFGEFERFALSSETMRGLGAILSSAASSVLTLNYDCIVEGLLESVSGVRTEGHPPLTALRPGSQELTRELLEYSHFNRNRPLGYGVQFDIVQLQQAGISKYVAGDLFYSQPRNQLISPAVLKLHGSINWFRYLPFRDRPIFPGEVAPSFQDVAEKRLLVDGHWWFGRPPSLDGWFLSPVIITPSLYKGRYISQPPFRTVWEHARASLRACRKLVIIGYSFPPSDFPVRRLLLESLSGRELEELIVVSPDPQIKELAAELCHFKSGVRWFAGVDEFVRAMVPPRMRQDRSAPRVPSGLSDSDPIELVIKCRECGERMTFMRAAGPRSVSGVHVSNSVMICSRGHATAFDGADLECVRVGRNQ